MQRMLYLPCKRENLRRFSNMLRLVFTLCFAAPLQIFAQSTPVPAIKPVLSPRYAVIDLGAGLIPQSINNHCQIIGTYQNNDTSTFNPFLWQNGSKTSLSSQFLYVTDINDNGDIIGWASLPTDPDGKRSVLIKHDASRKFLIDYTAYGPADAGAFGNVINNILYRV